VAAHFELAYMNMRLPSQANRKCYVFCVCVCVSAQVSETVSTFQIYEYVLASILILTMWGLKVITG